MASLAGRSACCPVLSRSSSLSFCQGERPMTTGASEAPMPPRRQESHSSRALVEIEFDEMCGGCLLHPIFYHNRRRKAKPGRPRAASRRMTMRRRPKDVTFFLQHFFQFRDYDPGEPELFIHVNRQPGCLHKRSRDNSRAFSIRACSMTLRLRASPIPMPRYKRPDMQAEEPMSGTEKDIFLSGEPTVRSR